ncbi:hypothetical protein [Aurantiacibacter luteus]|uniref:Uncharacterized protein n=1 Tax=Aurantiacibacter luteus TaxID=1581420 RepID=A0A0G9MU87_9SPHN|nr:hypothetical protein [Aurantiacibacter luteus]KLE34287.1 hypothetical protein AAW00_08540 [Aurantiacibacter luteus]
MNYVTADYSSIDPILDSWAVRQGVDWIRDDRGWDVRTLYWLVTLAKSVQLWVDEPKDGKTTVHVCHNNSKGRQQHTAASATAHTLEQVLDESFRKAETLASELTEASND